MPLTFRFSRSVRSTHFSEIFSYESWDNHIDRHKNWCKIKKGTISKKPHCLPQRLKYFFFTQVNFFLKHEWNEEFFLGMLLDF